MAHHCHAIGCSRACPPAYLMCPACWRTVPAPLQAAVYATVGKRDMGAIDETWSPWWRAQARAIASAARTAGHFTESQEAAYIVREDKVAEELAR
jgi:surfactin synthase thioesterase subunit